MRPVLNPVQRPLQLTAVLACLVVATGCGTSRQPGSEGPPASGEPPATSAPADPGGGTGSPGQSTGAPADPSGEPSGQPPGAPAPVKPRGGMAEAHPVKYLSAKPAPDGRTVTVTWWSGVEPCQVLDRVGVDYASKDVEITLYEGRDPAKKNPVCVKIAKKKSTVVQLKEPLGDRKVTDGAGG